jgi:hypothetical protein
MQTDVKAATEATTYQESGPVDLVVEGLLALHRRHYAGLHFCTDGLFPPRCPSRHNRHGAIPWLVGRLRGPQCRGSIKSGGFVCNERVVEHPPEKALAVGGVGHLEKRRGCECEKGKCASRRFENLSDEASSTLHVCFKKLEEEY